MPTYAQNLTTIRDQIVANLISATEDPKPNYSLGGQSVSWDSYVKSLTDQLETYNKLIQQAQSPFWKISRAKA